MYKWSFGRYEWQLLGFSEVKTYKNIAEKYTAINKFHYQVMVQNKCVLHTCFFYNDNKPISEMERRLALRW